MRESTQDRTALCMKCYPFPFIQNQFEQLVEIPENPVTTYTNLIWLGVRYNTPLERIRRAVFTVRMRSIITMEGDFRLI